MSYKQTLKKSKICHLFICHNIQFSQEIEDKSVQIFVVYSHKKSKTEALHTKTCKSELRSENQRVLFLPNNKEMSADHLRSHMFETNMTSIATTLE